MTRAGRERLTVQLPLWLIAAVAWAGMVAAASGVALPAICSVASASAASPFAVTVTLPTRASLDLALALNPPAGLLAGFALMLAGMMAPLLGAPLRHVRDRSFPRRRTRAVGLFLAGYGAVWVQAGIVLLALTLGVRLVLPASMLPLLAGLVGAFVWQASPAKQRCLNRCHAAVPLAPFGRTADLSVLRYGVVHGLWCIGACWALMLLPLLATGGHLAVMAAVSLWLLAERLEGPQPPRWRLRVPAKALLLATTALRPRGQGPRPGGAAFSRGR
ncbi:DUF2182 domain-containing protein [Jiella sp. M17.18]|uniref:copper chaperone n=1 Tax=Jiella sp. M17.18 TaxID=3234247 RepID=UPI0034DEC390